MSIIDFMDGGTNNRYQSITLTDGTDMRLGWRQDNQFSEIDRKYFSNHLGRDKRANGLRMALSYTLNDNQHAIVSSGMSLAEMMEDYRPDDYMAPNKHGFSSLLSSARTNAVGYKSQLSKKWSYQNAYASSKLSFGDELSTGPIDVKHNLILNRFSHRTSDNLNIAFDIGFLNEEGSVLGAISRGALEIGTAATTAFGGAKIDYQINADTMLFARASYGLTNVSGSSRSILGDVSKLKSYSYLVGIKGQKMIFDNDQLSFTISQPLRLSNGYASVSNVTDRNYETGELTTSYERISLNPTGTERDFELAYSINGFYGTNLKLNILHQLNPGHIKSIKSATSMLIRLGSNF